VIFFVSVVNIHSNRLARLLGKHENTQRFLRVVLFQGKPRSAIGASSVMQQMGAAAVTTSGNALAVQAEVCISVD
jgi:hypothetical protein